MTSALTKLKQFIRSPIGIVVLSTVGVAIAALIEGLLYAPNLVVLGKVVGTFALFGAFLGIIYATDPSEGIEVKARPVLRTIGSIGVGTILAVALPLSLTAAVICVIIFGVLGWLGMKWAKYVDF